MPEPATNLLGYWMTAQGVAIQVMRHYGSETGFDGYTGLTEDGYSFAVDEQGHSEEFMLAIRISEEEWLKRAKF